MCCACYSNCDDLSLPLDGRGLAAEGTSTSNVNSKIKTLIVAPHFVEHAFRKKKNVVVVDGDAAMHSR